MSRATTHTPTWMRATPEDRDAVDTDDPVQFVRDSATRALFESYHALRRWRQRTGSADHGEYAVRASQVDPDVPVYGPDAPAALATNGDTP